MQRMSLVVLLGLLAFAISHSYTTGSTNVLVGYRGGGGGARPRRLEPPIAFWNQTYYRQRYSEEERDKPIAELLKGFQFLVSQLALVPGETYYMRSDPDGDLHERLLTRIQSSGWNVTGVVTRILAAQVEQGATEYDTGDQLCRILKTDLENDNPLNYRCVVNVRESDYTAVKNMMYAVAVKNSDQVIRRGGEKWVCGGDEFVTTGINLIRIVV